MARMHMGEHFYIQYNANKTLTHTHTEDIQRHTLILWGEDLLYIVSPGTTGALCCCSCGTDLTQPTPGLQYHSYSSSVHSVTRTEFIQAI